jgi:hypothetical protein
MPRENTTSETRGRWENNIKLILGKYDMKTEVWAELTEYMDQWRAFV